MTSAPPALSAEREVGSDEAESTGDDAPAPGNGVDRSGAQSAVSVGDRRRQTAATRTRQRSRWRTPAPRRRRPASTASTSLVVAVGLDGARQRHRVVAFERAAVLDPGPDGDPAREPPRRARPRPPRASGRCSRGRARRSRSCAAATDATPRRRAARRAPADRGRGGRRPTRRSDRGSRRRARADDRARGRRTPTGPPRPRVAPRSPTERVRRSAHRGPVPLQKVASSTASWYTGVRHDLEVARAQHPHAARFRQLGVVGVVGGDVLEESRERFEAQSAAGVDVAEVHPPCATEHASARRHVHELGRHGLIVARAPRATCVSRRPRGCAETVEIGDSMSPDEGANGVGIP